jgi:hypothetical protein
VVAPVSGHSRRFASLLPRPGAAHPREQLAGASVEGAAHDAEDGSLERQGGEQLGQRAARSLGSAASSLSMTLQSRSKVNA